MSGKEPFELCGIGGVRHGTEHLRSRYMPELRINDGSPVREESAVCRIAEHEEAISFVAKRPRRRRLLRFFSLELQPKFLIRHLAFCMMTYRRKIFEVPHIPEVSLIRQLGRARREASVRLYIRRLGSEKADPSISHLENGKNARKYGQAKLDH
jgi:hypothetical protein